MGCAMVVCRRNVAWVGNLGLGEWVLDSWSVVCYGPWEFMGLSLLGLGY